MFGVCSLFSLSVSFIDGGILCLSDLVCHSGMGRSNWPSHWVPGEQEWANPNRQAPPLVGVDLDGAFSTKYKLDFHAEQLDFYAEDLSSMLALVFGLCSCYNSLLWSLGQFCPCHWAFCLMSSSGSSHMLQTAPQLAYPGTSSSAVSSRL